MRSFSLVSLCLAAVALVACGGTAPGVANVSLYLTDAPADEIASAQVWISRAYLTGGGAGEDGAASFTINGQPQSYDLLALQNGVTALLGTVGIPEGDYEQLRLVVDSARVTLAAGLTFSDGTTERSLKVPSGMQSGIKVTFDGPLHLAAGQPAIVVDFPVAENFVFQGVGTSPNTVLFRPTLHGTVQ